jgi:hypothetical protein
MLHMGYKQNCNMILWPIFTFSLPSTCYCCLTLSLSMQLADLPLCRYQLNQCCQWMLRVCTVELKCVPASSMFSLSPRSALLVTDVTLLYFGLSRNSDWPSPSSPTSLHSLPLSYRRSSAPMARLLVPHR